MNYQRAIVISPYNPSRALLTAIVSRLQTPVLYVAVVFVTLLTGLVLGVSWDDPMIPAHLIGLLVVMPVIWHRPSLGAYILVGGAAVFEAFPLDFPDSITDHALFLQSFRSAGGPGFMLTNAAEILMGYTLAVVALKRMARRESPIELGPLFWAVGFYIVMVGFGFVHGIGKGGNWEAAIAESRGQTYLLLAYLVIVNTIHERGQVVKLLWVFIAGVALKGVLGSWRFLVTLAGDLDNMKTISANSNSILSHEESYLFALFLVFGLVLYLFRSHKGQLLFVMVASLPVLVAFLANQRRAGSLALLIGIALAVFLTYRFLPSRRRLIKNVAIVLAVLMPIYMGATWNSTGLAAEPTRAVKSLIQPNARDETSNSYREIESLDLKYNIQIDPLLGRGYGKEIIFFIPLPDISYLFYWWDMIPHNTILWVWMRLGYVGFVAFWFLIGRCIIAAMMTTRNLSDRYLQGVGVFAAVVLVTWVFMGLVDMGIVDYRETLLIGLLIGLVSQLVTIQERMLRPSQKAAAGKARTDSPAPKTT